MPSPHRTLLALAAGLAPAILAACGEAHGPGAEPAARAAAISAGGEHSCLLTNGGLTYCWGWARLGQLGTGDTLNANRPMPVSGDFHFTSLSAGGLHTCALTGEGEAFCWGSNHKGALGADSYLPSAAAPLPVAGDLRFRQISAGVGHVCAVAADDAAYCWGQGEHGQLGAGDRLSRHVPTAVAGGLAFRAVSAGLFHSCGVTTDGTVYCWGENRRGQLGSGDTIASAVPRPVAGELRFAEVGTGSFHSCGLSETGAAHCWGSNSAAELGTGTTGSAPQVTPRPVSGEQAFRQLAVGSDHACGITPRGDTYCWGVNTYGKLGEGTALPTAVPLRVEAPVRFRQVAPGGNHTCAVSDSGEAYCWGWNAVGQLGDGTTATRPAPVHVTQ